jgi:hypothetical protein
MFQIPVTYINFQDNLYKVVRTFKSSKVPEVYVSDLKSYYNCEIALRAHDLLYLCELCHEAVIVEDDVIEEKITEK